MNHPSPCSPSLAFFVSLSLCLCRLQIMSIIAKFALKNNWQKNVHLWINSRNGVNPDWLNPSLSIITFKFIRLKVSLCDCTWLHLIALDCTWFHLILRGNLLFQGITSDCCYLIKCEFRMTAESLWRDCRWMHMMSSKYTRRQVIAVDFRVTIEWLQRVFSWMHLIVRVWMYFSLIALHFTWW